jgi:hypothetical protein
VPCRVVRVRPPREMQETGQRLQVMPYPGRTGSMQLIGATAPTGTT